MESEVLGQDLESLKSRDRHRLFALEPRSLPESHLPFYSDICGLIFIPSLHPTCQLDTASCYHMDMERPALASIAVNSSANDTPPTQSTK